MSVFSNLLKAAGEGALAAIDGVPSGDITSFTDTGSLALNALISGSLYGGQPRGKVTAIAGEEATGKTYFAISMSKEFLDEHPTGVVFYFESEGSITKEMLESRGIDLNRFIVIPVITIQDYRTRALNVLKEFSGMKEEDRPPLFFVLDSLGNLSTTKELEDSEAGKETRDMTRAGLVRGVFRTITLKLSALGVPHILTNHTYQVVGAYIPTKEMSSGGGLKYAASTILYLSKSKDRDTEKKVVGAIVKITAVKSRLTREQLSVHVRLNHVTGLDRYYGLTEIAIKAGVFKQLSKQIELPDGSKVFESKIDKNPEKYYTKDVLDKIEVWVNENFRYGAGEEPEDDDDNTEA